jgi:hypothetical protein
MKFENVSAFNFKNALRGMRNPKDSCHKNDTKESFLLSPDGEVVNTIVVIGENDMKLAKQLIKAGSVHRKFLRQIFVSVDISAPRYWWQEFDTYKIGTTENSCSTMHKIDAYEFNKDMFSTDGNCFDVATVEWWESTIKYLEYLRVEHNKAKKAGRIVKALDLLRAMKQALPEGFDQKRTVTLNYEVLINMVDNRKDHRLFEWCDDFMDFVRELPYASEFIFREGQNV